MLQPHLGAISETEEESSSPNEKGPDQKLKANGYTVEAGEGELSKKHGEQVNRLKNVRDDAAQPRRSIVVENSLRNGDSINIQVVRSAVASDKFFEIISELRNESAGNSLAEDVNHLYKDSIFDEVRKFGSASMEVQDFSCGTTFCAGSIIAGNDDTWTSFLKSFQENKESPSFALYDYPIDAGNGRIEHRFIFSTDSSNASEMVIQR